MGTPSRLWKKLGATRSVFYVSSAGHNTAWDDDAIRSLTVTRGADSPAGVTKNTATVELAGAIAPVPMDNNDVLIRLTNYGRDLVEAKIGKGPWGGINNRPVQHRFRGRVAGQKVTDTGDRNPAQWGTTLTCADWTSLLSAVDADAQIVKTPNNNPITKLITSMISRAKIEHVPAPVLLGTQWHHVNWKPTDPDTRTFSVSKVENHFIKQLGYLLRTCRDGATEFLDTIFRDDRANQVGVYFPQPLTRAACLRPVSWEQRVTIPGGVRWLQNNGTTYTIWSGGSGSTDGVPIEYIDFSDVFVIGTLWDAMTARMSRSTRSGYTLSTLTVDVLDLFNRESSSEHDLLAQLLTMEPGDPLQLGNDWPGSVTGVYTLTRISETITPDSWRLTLDVCPIEWATGKPAYVDAIATWDTYLPAGWSWETTGSTPWDEALRQL